MIEIMYAFCAGAALVAALVCAEDKIEAVAAQRRRHRARQRRAAVREAVWRAQHPRTLEELNAQNRGTAKQRLQLAENLRQTTASR